jgi:hypothetical protein
MERLHLSLQAVIVITTFLQSKCSAWRSPFLIVKFIRLNLQLNKPNLRGCSGSPVTDYKLPARTHVGSLSALHCHVLFCSTPLAHGLALSHTCWLVKCFALSRTILLDSVEFGKVKLKSAFKNLHNYLKINVLAKKAKNTEGVTFQNIHVLRLNERK